MSDVTRILQSIEDGNPKAAEELLPLVYDELRNLAAARLAAEKPGQTLQATALVHEAWLRLVPGDGRDSADARQWDGRGHFFAAAAEAMRRILVDNARRKMRVRHGGEMDRADVDVVDLPTRLPPERLIALDDALATLREEDPVKARLIELRYFVGMTIEQAAETLQISRVSAHRYWVFAKARLHQEMMAED